MNRNAGLVLVGRGALTDGWEAMESKLIGVSGRLLSVHVVGPLVGMALALVSVWLVSPFSVLPRRQASPPSAPLGQTWSLASDDSKSSAQLTQAAGAFGTEQMRGITHLRSGGRVAWVEADERAELTETGSLQHAEVSLSYGDPALALELDLAARVTLDAGAGEVSVQELDGRTESHRVATDYPWVYLALRLPGGAFVSTPVGMTVARRAAQTRGVVRLITAGEGDASVMSDQIAVVDASSDFIVLGNDLATFERAESGQSELVALRVQGLGIELKQQHAKRLL